LKAVASAEFEKLDPTGTRRRLFEKHSAEAIQVRDIIMVRTKTEDPFAGVVLRIQRKQHDSSVLLRNTITGVGVEKEFKIFSPNVTGIEVVQRRTKVPKQTRLFYMR
jgi:large subunit ribosomal protein L19